MDTYYLKKNHFQKESSPPVPDDVNDERPAVGLVGGKDQKVSLSLSFSFSLSLVELPRYDGPLLAVRVFLLFFCRLFPYR